MKAGIILDNMSLVLFDMFSAGLHPSLSISKLTQPLESTLT